MRKQSSKQRSSSRHPARRPTSTMRVNKACSMLCRARTSDSVDRSEVRHAWIIVTMCAFAFSHASKALTQRSKVLHARMHACLSTVSPRQCPPPHPHISFRPPNTLADLTQTRSQPQASMNLWSRHNREYRSKDIDSLMLTEPIGGREWVRVQGKRREAPGQCCDMHV